MNPKWYVFSILLFLCLVSTGSATTEDLTPIAVFPSVSEFADEFALESATRSVGILQAPGLEEQLTTDSLFREYPKTDGTHIIWVEWEVASKIWYYDIASKSLNKVSNVNNNQNYPDLQGGTVVWQESADKKSIMSASLSPIAIRTVYTSDTIVTKPAVYGDQVVWEDYAGSDHTNILYQRIGVGIPVVLSPSQNTQSNPRIYGNYVVWQQLDAGRDDWNIYLFDLTTGQLKQLTRDRSAQINPDITENLIVWEDHRNGASNIMVHDMERDLTTAVTFDSTSNILPAVSKNIIVWSRMGDDGYDLYMVNLAGPSTYLVAGAPGDQIYADIETDIIVWQDTRFGGSNIFYYRLNPETQFLPHLFFGSATMNFQPLPVDSVIEARIDGEVKGSITITQAGQYGTSNQASARQLVVPITQQDLGKTISFWYNGIEGLPRVQVSGSGGMMEWPLEFSQGTHLGDIMLRGTVRLNGMLAPAGTIISASIDGATRSQFTITEAGFYGSISPGAPEFIIPVLEQDLGRTMTFSIGNIRADQSFPVQPGGIFTLDLTGTDQPGPVPTWTPGPVPTWTSAPTWAPGPHPTQGLEAYLDATPRSGPAPLTVQFVDLSAGSPTLWVWSFGDGSSQSLEQYPSHTFTEPGTYTVTLEVANAQSFASITMPNYITVTGQAGPQPTWIPGPTPVPTLGPGPQPTWIPGPTPVPTPGPGPIPLDASEDTPSPEIIPLNDS